MACTVLWACLVKNTFIFSQCQLYHESCRLKDMLQGFSEETELAVKCLTDFSGSGPALNREVYLVCSLLLASCFLFGSPWQCFLFTPEWWLYWMVKKGHRRNLLLPRDLAATHSPLSHSQCNKLSMSILILMTAVTSAVCTLCFTKQLGSVSNSREFMLLGCVNTSVLWWLEKGLIQSQGQLQSRGLLFPIPGDQGISSSLFVFLLNFETDSVWVIGRLYHIVWRK